MSSKENSLLNQMSSQRKQKQSEPLSWESEKHKNKYIEKNNICSSVLTVPRLIRLVFTQKVAELRVQSFQKDAELKELLLHGLLGLLKVVVLRSRQQSSEFICNVYKKEREEEEEEGNKKRWN